jgi:RING-box protein 1
MKINWVKPIGYWVYNLKQEDCAICRVSLNQPALGYQTTQQNANVDVKDYFNVETGKCQHAFHAHCIKRWLKTRPVCPMCNGQLTGTHKPTHEHSMWVEWT